MAIAEQSNDAAIAAVAGTNTGSGTGVHGESDSGAGVSGHSITADALLGDSSRGVGVRATAHGSKAAIECVNDDPTENAGPGVHARSRATAVVGESSTWIGVYGLTQSTTGGHGMMGQSVGIGAGVAGDSTRGPGVLATSHGTAAGAECSNDNATDAAGPGLRASSRGAGVIGVSETWMGVYGETHSSTGGNGVMGHADGIGAGVAGDSTDGTGVVGVTTGVSYSTAGVRGIVQNNGGLGTGVVGDNQGRGSGVLGHATHDAGVVGLGR